MARRLNDTVGRVSARGVHVLDQIDIVGSESAEDKVDSVIRWTLRPHDDHAVDKNDGIVSEFCRRQGASGIR